MFERLGSKKKRYLNKNYKFELQIPRELPIVRKEKTE